MHVVEFKFGIGEKVRTSLGVLGVVNTQGYSRGGNQYYIHTETNALWIDEAELTPTN